MTKTKTKTKEPKTMKKTMTTKTAKTVAKAVKTEIKAAKVGPLFTGASTEQDEKPKAVKVAKAPKAPAATVEPKVLPLKVRLYAKGEFYFGRALTERIGEKSYLQVILKGSTATFTPVASEKEAHPDAYPVGRCHAAKVMRTKALLQGFTFETQDLIATAIGNTGFQVKLALDKAGKGAS